ncbi:SDR family oxidoreductase [Sinorhizobium chiapasense]|uniref:SDR family oxidoreductase n=1 Tax=Sinorhizobium chiapasense TaxID=501572 RepID=A0ABZ2B438_9HYPH
MILVTGASGYVGGAALKRLSERGHPVSAMVRNLGRAAEVRAGGVPIRIANYDDRASLERAFEGADRLVFVASDGDARAVMRQHANVIDAAADAGVGHIVFTSIVDIDAASAFYFTPVYRDAERRLAERGTGATILRCGLYADLILSNWLRPARETGEIAVPLADARVAPISRDDVAEALANVAASETPGGLYHLTGPRAYSFEEIATATSAAFGVKMRYVPCAPADYLARLLSEAPDPWPHAFSSLCRSISEDRYGAVFPDFERLVGRPAENFESFLRKAKAGRPR